METAGLWGFSDVLGTQTLCHFWKFFLVLVNLGYFPQSLTFVLLCTFSVQLALS